MLNQSKSKSKKLVYIALVLIIALVFVVFYFLNSPNKEDLVSSETTLLGNVIKARQSNMLFDYKKANTFYNYALKIDEYNESLLEEYLLFAVSQQNFQLAFDLSQKIILNVPDHSLANLVLIVNNIKNNDLDGAILHLQSLSPIKGSVNDILLNILLSLKAYESHDIKGFKEKNKNIAQVLPDFYQYLLGVSALYYNDISIAKETLLEFNNTYPNIDSIVYYSQILKSENEKKAIEYFSERLNDNYISNDLIKSYIVDTKTISLQKIVSDSILNISRLMPNEINQNFLTSDEFTMTNVALLLDPANYGAVLSRAAFYENIGNYSEAIKNYKTLPHNNYFSRLSSTQIVNILIDLGKYDDAIDFLNDQIYLEPNNPINLLKKGEVYNLNNDYKKAISTFDKVLDISEKNNYVLATWLANYYMGVAYDKIDNWKEAEKHLVKAYSLDKNDPLLVNYLAYSWIDRNYNITESLVMLQKILNSDPNNAAILDSYAWGLFKSKQYNQALKYAKKANEINPYDPILADHMGDIMWQNKKPKDAINYWTMAMNLSDNNNLSIALKQKINGELPKYLDQIPNFKFNSGNDFINKVKNSN